MEKISLKGMVSLAFLKKERFTGSHGKMCYMICMADGQLNATAYPGPFCWEVTPDEQKETEVFDFTQEGLEAAVAWLNQKYEEKYRS